MPTSSEARLDSDGLISKLFCDALNWYSVITVYLGKVYKMREPI